MTAQSSIPLKWYVPFANGDSGRVELPVTTADPTRASQTLGFPPLTMQPPESGGVPPQGEDFNGGMNQIARVAWWVLNGGGWPYDSTFATNSNINGYPKGATLQSADFLGNWLNLADNNQNNPDTNGTNWVPGFQYGVTTISGLTNANVTLTPLQAAKRRIVLSGTLTGNIQIILPAWTMTWEIVDSTSGNFTIIVKTPAGSGVTTRQNGNPQTFRGDGTNIIAEVQNVPFANSRFCIAQMQQASGIVGSSRNWNMFVVTATATPVITLDEIVMEQALGGVRYCRGGQTTTLTPNFGTVGANGMDTGLAPVSGYLALYMIYGPTNDALAVLGQDVTGLAGAATELYSGGNLPAGYAASALVAVVPTNASRQISPILVRDRCHYIPAAQVLNTTTQQASPISLSIAAAVPKNAKYCSGTLAVASTSATPNTTLQVYPSGNNIGLQGLNSSVAAAGGVSAPFSQLALAGAQTLYYLATATAGTPTFTIAITEYQI